MRVGPRAGVRSSSLLLTLVLATSCAAGDPVDEIAAPPTTTGGDPDPAADAAEVLPTPFTAEAIRDAFRPGLEIRFYSRAPPDPRELSRMRVIEADAAGARIEQASLDDDGRVVGETRVTASAWSELRDHASFPGELAARRSLRRPTPLGELDGWLYTVRDRDGVTVTEYFFAHELPGPPVTMVVRSLETRDVLREYLQVLRNDVETKPLPPPAAPAEGQ